MTVLPRLQFMKEEEMKRCAGEFVDLDDVVWMDVWKVQFAWHEDVDLEPLETEFVVIGVPPQCSPIIPGVARPDSIEVVVFLA